MSKSISFITETEVEEKKRKRQEEWEQQRKPDDPEEAPEEKYDPRTLYERLQEQKNKKQEEYDESHKLKNLIKTLDNDEIEFLQGIDSTKAEYENQKYQEELQAIEEYKRTATDLTVEEQERRLMEFKRELFQKAKKRKEMEETGEQHKRKATQAELLSKVIKRKAVVGGASSGTSSAAKEAPTPSSVSSSSSSSSPKETMPANMPTIQCIGRLPGIGCYDGGTDSSDSDRESDEDDVEDFQVFADPPAKERGGGCDGHDH